MKKTKNTIGNKTSFFPAKREFIFLRSKLQKIFDEVGNDGRWILGKKVEKFEKKLADFVCVKNVISCASGTDAISLSLMSLGVGFGDKVIVPANSYPSVFGVIASGAMPVLVDVGRNDGNLDPKKLNEKLKESKSNKIKAVLVVHMYGYPADLDEIRKICKKNNLYLIEDCAQAIGSRYKEKHVGVFSDLAIYSFYPTKNLGALGDGGAIVTNNNILSRKLRMIRMYGEMKRYNAEFYGRNSRLDELQAGFLLIKMKYLKRWLDRRRKLAKKYLSFLSGIDEILLPNEKFNRKHAYHLFVVKTKKRDKLMKWLKKYKIETVIHYPKAIHETKAFKSLGKKGDFWCAEEWSKQALSFPLHPFLKDEEVLFVAKKVREFFK